MSAEVYTMEQWQHDFTFKAKPGMQISKEIYDYFLNMLPPLSLCEAEQARLEHEHGIQIDDGFLLGEEEQTGADGLLYYMAFGYTEPEDARQYYYLGLAKAKGFMS